MQTRAIRGFQGLLYLRNKSKKTEREVRATHCLEKRQRGIGTEVNVQAQRKLGAVK